MAKHVFAIITEAPPADEAEAFERWYVDRHIPDVLDVPGFTAAQRYLLAPDPNAPDAPPRSLTIYEIEADDRTEAMAEVRRRAGTDRMPLYEGSARAAPTSFLGTAVTPRILPGQG